MLIQTPSQTVGPFFHDGLVFGGENVLVDEQTQGQRILIRGSVLDGTAQPIPDALIEIWQADALGCFNHPADPNQAQADTHFRGFGRAGTVRGGQFFFKTIKPGMVAGPKGHLQAPHITVRVFARGMLIHLYTRLYFSDEHANATDWVLNACDAARRSTLIAVKEETNDLITYRFDIHLQGEHETVFFEP
jgi:protocatechuate 3,4-dioxygenase, alpha subunit